MAIIIILYLAYLDPLTRRRFQLGPSQSQCNTLLMMITSSGINNDRYMFLLVEHSELDKNSDVIGCTARDGLTVV